MDSIRIWFDARWQDTLIPLAVFVGVLGVALWARRIVGRRLARWAERTRTRADDILVAAAAKPSRLWPLLGAAAIALQASQLADDPKQDVARAIWSVFGVSLAVGVAQGIEGLLTAYGEEMRLPRRVLGVLSRAAWTIIALMTVLALMALWSLPVGPVLIGGAVFLAVTALLLRDIVPGVLASLTLMSSGQVRVGDYIKLESGESGYVSEVRLGHVQVMSSDGARVLIPASKLFRVTVVNYGRRPKPAKAPFVFYSRTYLKELTGLKAGSLKELAAIVKAAPAPGIYYHTHYFLEEHQYLTREPANDFALWVTDVLGEQALGERLAAVDTFQFSSLEELRHRLVGLIEEHLASAGAVRTAREGQEFHLIKSVSFVTPNGHRASDLREFAEEIKDLPLNSVYYHVFEARMRLGRATNDFSLWLEESCGAPELAGKFSRLDPYNHTLEALRSSLVRMVEQHIG